MQSLNKELEQTEFTQEFQAGVFILKNFPFADCGHIEELTSWIQPKNLHSLVLQDCKISEKESVAKRAREHECNYRYISGNLSPTLQRLKKTKADALAELIVSKQWAEITLSSNNLTSDESKIIIKAITKSQRNLRKLDLGHNALSDPSMRLLANYLKHKTKCSLKYLYIPGTIKHYSSWFKLLFESLQENTTLRELDLSSNYLENEDIKALIAILKADKLKEGNSVLVDVKLTGCDRLRKKTTDELDHYLEQNREKRAELHKALIGPEFLQSQAITAVKNNDPEWLDVLIGLDKTEEEHESTFNITQQRLFFQYRQPWFITSVLKLQYKFLQGITQEELNDPLRYQDLQENLDQITREHINAELSIVSEHLSRVTLYVDDEGKVVPLTNHGRDTILEQYDNKIIKPCMERYDLVIEPEMQLQAHIDQRRRLATIYKREAELNKKLHNNLQFAYYDYIDEKQRLLRLMKRLELGGLFSSELEEIADKLIQAHIDPNQIINEQQDTLLLFSLQLQSADCFAILLARGGDILHKNVNGRSVLNDLFLNDNFLTPCHKILINHIQNSLEKIWFDIEQYPIQQKFIEIKNVIDRYLTILVKNSHMPKIKQFFTGIRKCLAERQHEVEKLYGCLENVRCVSLSEMPIEFLPTPRELFHAIISQMFHITETAKRGWLHHSKLHDSVRKELLLFMEKLNVNEAVAAIDKLEKDYFEEKEALEKHDAEIDEFIKNFEVVQENNDKQPISEEKEALEKHDEDIETFEIVHDNDEQPISKEKEIPPDSPVVVRIKQKWRVWRGSMTTFGHSLLPSTRQVEQDNPPVTPVIKAS